MAVAKHEQFVVILVTAADESQALEIARALVERRLAACVNLVGGVRSIFRWNDAIEEAREHLLIIKSRKSLVDSVIEAVRELHSYQTPEVIALPILAGSKPYMLWLSESLRTAARRSRTR
jgi:periplasmic divalent cation tolerance protein